VLSLLEEWEQENNLTNEDTGRGYGNRMEKLID